MKNSASCENNRLTVHCSKLRLHGYASKFIFVDVQLVRNIFLITSILVYILNKTQEKYLRRRGGHESGGLNKLSVILIKVVVGFSFTLPLKQGNHEIS